MVKTELKILDHENKTSKGGKGKKKVDYTRFRCEYSDGSIQWMSAFEEDLIEDLKENEGKLISVDVVQPEGSDWWNLREFYEIIVEGEDGPEAEEKEKPKTVNPENIGKSYDERHISYAKDIFNILWPENLKLENPSNEGAVMQIAIDLVKQETKAFS